MDGSKDKYGVTINDVFALVSGTISEDKRRQVAKAIYDPEHPLSYLARQSTKNEPYIEDWPPSESPADVEKLLQDGTVADAGGDSLRSLINAAIEPYLQGSKKLSELENRAIVDKVCKTLATEIDQQLLLNVASALEEALDRFLNSEEFSADLTDTVSAGLDTTFAASAANPDLARKRHEAIKTFRQVNIEQCNTYLLSEFAGRSTDEIATIQNLAASDVAQRLLIARAEISALMDG